jgi:hypothetical protein
MRVLVASSFVAAGLLWAGAGAAHPGYPLVVEQTLGLSAVYDPSGNNGGCYLCHTSTAGGTALRPFGNLLVTNFGLSSDPVNEDDPSLVAALKSIEASPDAQFITDIKDGKDPNDDPLIDEAAPPTPEYGCALAAAPGAPAGEGSSAAGLVVAAGLALVGARRARRNDSQKLP